MAHVKIELSEQEIRDLYEKFKSQLAKTATLSEILSDERFRETIREETLKNINTKKDAVQYKII